MLLVHEIEICIKDNIKDKCIEIGKDLFEEALKIRSEMIRRGDLRTRWWVRFIGALFYPVTTRAGASFSYKDIDGTSRGQTVKGSLEVYSCLLNTYSCSNRFWISVGSGDTPPTIDDYRLSSKIGDALASYALDDVNGIISLSAGFTFASDTVINEVGLEWEACLSSYTGCGRILVDRTVLSSPFTAPANTPITVTYKIVV